MMKTLSSQLTTELVYLEKVVEHRRHSYNIKNVYTIACMYNYSLFSAPVYLWVWVCEQCTCVCRMSESNRRANLTERNSPSSVSSSTQLKQNGRLCASAFFYTRIHIYSNICICIIYANEYPHRSYIISNLVHQNNKYRLIINTDVLTCAKLKFIDNVQESWYNKI